MRKYFIALLISIISTICFLVQIACKANTGYEPWLNYKIINNLKLEKSYKKYCKRIQLCTNRHSDVIKDELNRFANKSINIKPDFENISNARIIYKITRNKVLGDEGYPITTTNGIIRIEANKDAGLLYGTFHLIRLMQCSNDINNLNIKEVPQIELRQLNHWDDLNGNIERGYARKNLWNWNELPLNVDKRYTDYARANASIGINGVVLNNVNADALLPHKGIVMWRTFVYNTESVDKDRMKRSYKEFMPYDGQFMNNVTLQTKNGPLDFQPS